MKRHQQKSIRCSSTLHEGFETTTFANSSFDVVFSAESGEDSVLELSSCKKQHNLDKITTLPMRSIIYRCHQSSLTSGAVRGDAKTLLKTIQKARQEKENVLYNPPK